MATCSVASGRIASSHSLHAQAHRSSSIPKMCRDGMLERIAPCLVPVNACASNLWGYIDASEWQQFCSTTSSYYNLTFVSLPRQVPIQLATLCWLQTSRDHPPLVRMSSSSKTSRSRHLIPIEQSCKVRMAHLSLEPPFLPCIMSGQRVRPSCAW